MNLKTIVESLDGWCEVSKADRLFNLVKESDSKLTVELGVFGGRSLIPMALAHKEKGSGNAVGIDAWTKEPCIEGTNAPANNDYWASVDFPLIYKRCLAGIERNGVGDCCDVMKMTTLQAGMLFGDDSVDIIHQDSSHNIETITAELKLWIPKLKVGGYWVADDVQWVEAVEGYSQLPDYGLELFEAFDTWEIWKKVK